MRFATSLAAAILISLTFRPPAGLAAVFIQINKSAQQMTVSVDGEPRYVWPVSTGRPGYDTPSGSYRAFRMEADHFSKEWDDAPMPHSIFFTTEGHAIHGTDHTRSLGMPASHGCVRLSRAHAATLFNLVKQEGLLSTKVVLTGKTPTRAPLVARHGTPEMGDGSTAQPPMNLSPGNYGQFDENSNGFPFFAPQRPDYGTRPAPVFARPYNGQN